MALIGKEHTGHKQQVLICDVCEAELRRKGMKGLLWVKAVGEFAAKHINCERTEKGGK